MPVPVPVIIDLTDKMQKTIINNADKPITIMLIFALNFTPLTFTNVTRTINVNIQTYCGTSGIAAEKKIPNSKKLTIGINR